MIAAWDRIGQRASPGLICDLRQELLHCGLDGSRILGAQGKFDEDLIDGHAGIHPGLHLRRGGGYAQRILNDGRDDRAGNGRVGIDRGPAIVGIAELSGGNEGKRHLFQ